MSGLQTTTRGAVQISEPRVTGAAAPHVLLADPNPTSRTVREAQLDAAGLRVTVARTPFETIVKASCQVPDLILLDESLVDGEIDLPEINRLLTTCPVTAHIPVVSLVPHRRVPRRVVSDLRRRASA
jgi:CheY-like chemotaxis protein